MSDSPYRPGFGQAPVVLAGRDEFFDLAREAMEVVGYGRTPQPIMLHGPRGTGKTVLLEALGLLVAEERGWPRIRIEITRDGHLCGQFLARSAALLQALVPRRRLRSTGATVRAGVGGVGAEVRLERPLLAELDLHLRLEASLAALAAHQAQQSQGIVITLDELQLADRIELSVVGAVLQAGTEARWPMMVVAAGLGVMREDERSVTYFERGRWREIGLLDELATLRALVGPARMAGREFEPAAAQILAEASGGYPYAIQVHGQQAWAASEGYGQITLAAALQARQSAEAELSAGLYASRWAQCSAREQAYLVAVAELIAAGEPATGSAVAARLGKTTAQLSSCRPRLLAKTTLFADRRQLHFATPGMVDFVLGRA